MKYNSNIPVANAARKWAAITATSIMIKLMMIRRVLMLRLLTKAIRSTLSTRAGAPGSSRRANLKGALCIGYSIPIDDKDL